MRWFLIVTSLAILLLTLIVPPAPATISFVLIVLTLLMTSYGVVFVSNVYYYPKRWQEFLIANKNFLIILLAYIAVILMAMLNGFFQHLPAFTVLRSTLSYLVFLPFIFIRLISKDEFKINDLYIVLILAGIAQVGYHFYLFYGGDFCRQSIISVLFNRITLLDGRTTVPLYLASAILPFAFIIEAKELWKILLNIFLVAISVVGAMLTLTRSMLLAVFLGWIVFAVVLLFLELKRRKFTGLAKIIAAMIIIFSTLFFLNKTDFSVVNEAFLLRSYGLADLEKLDAKYLATLSPEELREFLLKLNHMKSNLWDLYSTGRIQEWDAAIATWTHSNPKDWTIGIGAGYPIKITSQVTQTYVHNLLINNLVYMGVVGLVVTILYYSIIGLLLLRKVFVFQNTYFVGLLALLAAMLFYAQLFVVYKLFSYNLMLCLIIAFALKSNESDQLLLRDKN